MKFDLKKPCDNCPFRSDRVFYLHEERVEEILHGMIEEQRTVTCHKTIDYSKEDESGEHIAQPDDQHCAGALILLEKINRPNQMMRIAERCGFYDRTKLNMASPVYDTPEEMRRTIRNAHKRSTPL